MPRELKLESRLALFPDEESLPTDYLEIVKAAKEGATNAYAPYSNFKVGAAVIDSKHQVVTGSNQENAAYPSGLCAERVALFSYFSQKQKAQIDLLAVVAFRNGTACPAHPCGSCRQTILEYERFQDHPIKIIMAHEGGAFLVADSIEDLLPLGFTKQDLPPDFRKDD